MQQFLALVLLLSFALVLSSSQAALAEETGDASDIHVAGSLALTSDYVFRGVTQTDGHPALQGSAELVYDLNPVASLYAGLWASNVDFNDGDEASLEMDWTTGVRFQVGNISFDTGLIYYYYPGADSDLNYDFLELQGKATYDFDFATATLSLNYSPDNFGNSDDAFYPRFTVVAPLPHDFSINGWVGRQHVSDNAAFALPDYTDWGVGLSYAYETWSFGATYTGSSIDDDDCPDNCGDRVAFTITKTF